ncbi:MAG: polysaccharide biosynthesis protein [Lachnospiraceae bacterium]|nr:polysaccharide biosynthesis protein [Lachnospiraceae bacterium]
MKTKFNLWNIPISRIIILLILDLISVVLASYGALYWRFEFSFEGQFLEYAEFATVLLPFDLVITVVIFWALKLYKSVWRYASTNELINISVACIICFFVQIILVAFLPIRMPRSYYPMYAFLLMIMVCGTRFSYRIIRMFNNKRLSISNDPEKKNTMVIGAGAAGNAIIKEIESSTYINMRVMCVIDDDPGCHKKLLRGIPIVGDRTCIQDAAEAYHIEEIIIAIPSASRLKVREILEICKETGCKMQLVPGMYQLINGDVNVSSLRQVQIEDLLGRDPIEVNVDEIIGYVKNKVVMVTGGGGSIGSELCRQVAGHGPKQLIIVDIYENNAYDIQQELKGKHPDLNLTVLIASVRNTARMNTIFQTYHPDIIYHAAAHKHVPLMEDSPIEAIKNNVFGTLKTATAAGENGAKKFVLISTDKAVNPTNIMGASKRICEMIIQQLNQKYSTEFVAVRFGNVLGSNGSVIPLFKKQIEQGGPVTVTHKDIIRYFMTIPEAVSLVLQAGAYAKGGEIFILDMGEPVRIYDLAENLIKLSGYIPGEDIEIKITGLRPGEKLYEELLMSEEGMKDTANHLIHIGKPIEVDENEFKEGLDALAGVVADEGKKPEDVRAVVKRMVPTYVYQKT